jgi:NAD(P)-dependent dehydrogenase (short-subunit alcohol dehydrogenase family)
MTDRRSLRPGDLFSLAGMTAIVTGGSRGIGRAIVQALAEAGADVVIASRKLDSCVVAASEVAIGTGRSALPVQCHVGRWDDCDRLVSTTLEHFGRLDVLVNNAGISPLYESLGDITEELYDKTHEVNLKGPFRLSTVAGTYMAEHDGGSIVNIGTIGSVIATPHALPYACAKAGLNALTVGLAEALAPKVRVNAILPGSFRTDVTRSWTPEMLAGESIPLQRIGEPDEVGGLVVYLSSAAATYTTGAIVRVDGGVTRHV